MLFCRIGGEFTKVKGGLIHYALQETNEERFGENCQLRNTQPHIQAPLKKSGKKELVDIQSFKRSKSSVKVIFIALRWKKMSEPGKKNR